MIFPFRQKASQKKWGIILTVGGIVITIASPKIVWISEMISSANIGLVISGLGIIYVLEAVANGQYG